MKRSLKMWSWFWLYMAIFCVLIFISTLFLSYEYLNSINGLVVYGGVFVVGILFGLFIFKEDKVVNGINEIPILLESVYGVNVDSFKEDGVVWDDIERARTLLKGWKKQTNFSWSPINLYDIIVVCYLNDDKKDMTVKVLKNTRLLQFKGVIHKKNDKLKLDTLDLSNFNTSLLKDLGYLDGSSCVLKCVRPIDRKYLEKYFSNISYESYVYDVIAVKGV